MRLLSIIHGPVYGGGHAQLIRLARPLAAEGIETVAVVPEEPGTARSRLEQAGIDVVALPLHRLRRTTDPRTHAALLGTLGPEVGRLGRLIRARGIDVVQVHGDTNVHGAFAARLTGTALVWQLYDTVTPPPLRRVTMPLVTRLADVITTWGRELADIHPGATSLGDRCLTVYPPVAADEFSPPDAERRAAARAELGVPDGRPVLLSVGNRNPTKGHEWLMRAAARLQSRDVPPVVRILGGESAAHREYEQGLHDEAGTLGLVDPTLRLVDPGRRVPQLLAAADVFVLASVPRSEGMPTVILEAMACGLPVVATDVGAVREIVEDGVTGFVVAPEDRDALADAIARLLDEPELRARLGRAGLERFRATFGLGALAARHAHAYRTAVEHRRHRTGS